MARVRFVIRWSLLLSAAVLAACARSYGPAPVVFRDGGGIAGGPAPQYEPPRPQPEKPPEIRPAPELQPWPESGVAIVRKGDTLYRISRRYGLPVSGLAARNGLTEPYHLAPGQRIVLQRPMVHVVQSGETVYSLARHYGLEMADLVRHNRIRPPFGISVGQHLRIPTVQPKYDEIRRVALSPEQTSSAAALDRPPPRRNDPFGGWRGKVPPGRTGGGFLWPVRGTIVVGFGAQGKGLYNDGINISAAVGTPVRATENGLVTYAGNQLRGFGNLVLLKHADGWSSAYAHNARLKVRSGQRVRRGEIIAEVGRTGSVVRPQLHFELRRGDDAVDPQKHLTVRTARPTPISRVERRAFLRDPG